MTFTWDNIQTNKNSHQMKLVAAELTVITLFDLL